MDAERLTYDHVKTTPSKNLLAKVRDKLGGLPYDRRTRVDLSQPQNAVLRLQ